MTDEQTYVDEQGRTVHHTEYPHIVKVEGLRGGRPVIEGTGFEVWIMGGYFEDGMTVEGIVADWDYLTPAQVFSALAYYYDHKAEIDSEMERDREEFERARDAAWETSPMRAKLEALGRVR